jgi:hypothetical protein
LGGDVGLPQALVGVMQPAACKSAAHHDRGGWRWVPSRQARGLPDGEGGGAGDRLRRAGPLEIKRVPVIVDGALVGMVSRANIVRAVAARA